MQIYRSYRFVSSQKNPHFAEYLNCLKPESCLLAPNVKKSPIFIASAVHRRKTTLNVTRDTIDVNTGEITTDYINIEHNDVEHMKKRARKKLLGLATIMEHHESLARNTDKYKPFFITLTAPSNNCEIREFLNRLKINLRNWGADVLYHLWALEFGKKGTHPHYHIVIWVKDFRKASHYLRNNFGTHKKRQQYQSIKSDLLCLFPEVHGWKGRTSVEPVKKSVYRYLTKYFTKEENYICRNRRNYGFGQLSCRVRVPSTQD